MADKRTIDVYDEKAAEYIKLTATSAPDAHLQGFIDAVVPGGVVLDFGCGPATASAHMRAAGLRPDPLDASQGMVDLANDTYAINARLGTFDDLTEIGRYDGVWANFSLLHASHADLPRYIKAIATALKPAGVFHIGMKTGEGQARDSIERLYSYISVQDLRGLISDAGFDISFTQEGKDTGLSGSVDAFVIMRAIKHG